MRRARFPVLAQMDSHRFERGTVTIERGADLFSVRPFRRRRRYELPLSAVVRIVVERVIRAEIAAKKAERKLSRRKSRPQ